MKTIGLLFHIFKWKELPLKTNVLLKKIRSLHVNGTSEFFSIDGFVCSKSQFIFVSLYKIINNFSGNNSICFLGVYRNKITANSFNFYNPIVQKTILTHLFWKKIAKLYIAIVYLMQQNKHSLNFCGTENCIFFVWRIR